MKRSGYINRYLHCIIFILFYLIALRLNADPSPTPFSIGETIRYSVHISGVKVGTQTIKLVSEETFNGSAVYKIWGITKTTGISRLFHQYSEQWTMLIDSTTLYPVWIERHIEDRGISSSYTYFFDQAQKKVIIFNRDTGEKKIIYTKNVIFDQYLISLCYFYRKNPLYFKGDFSFDFLKKESVKTAYMREEGQVQVRIPKLSGNDTTTTYKFREEGGDGIEIYTGIDGFTIPLKIIFRIPLSNKKKQAVIELYIMDYTVTTGNKSIPKQYRPLLNEDLLVMNG